MAFLNPEKSVRNEEILHFRLSVVIDLGSPVRMLALPGILMLVNGGAVEVRKSVGVLGK